MRATAALTVGPGGRIEALRGQAPLAWRPAAGAFYLVGTAASPVGRDRVTVRVTARPAARVAVRSSAATVLWAGTQTHLHVEAAVGDGGVLDWAPEPVVVTGRCDHLQSARVGLAGPGRLRWREVVVLGRAGERPGRLRTRLAVTVDGRTLLRHDLDIGDGFVGWDGPAVLGPARVMALELRAGAGWPRPVPAAGPGWSVTPLEGPGALAVALGSGVGEVEERLGRATAGLAPL